MKIDVEMTGWKQTKHPLCFATRSPLCFTSVSFLHKAPRQATTAVGMRTCPVCHQGGCFLKEAEITYVHAHTHEHRKILQGKSVRHSASVVVSCVCGHWKDAQAAPSAVRNSLSTSAGSASKPVSLVSPGRLCLEWCGPCEQVLWNMKEWIDPNHW